MPESPTGQTAILLHPTRRRDRLVQKPPLAGVRVKHSDRAGRPAVFARVPVLVDAWDSLPAARSVVELEVFAAVLAIHQVGVLAGVEPALGTAQKGNQEPVDAGSGFQISRIAPLRVTQRVEAIRLSNKPDRATARNPARRGAGLRFAPS